MTFKKRKTPMSRKLRRIRFNNNERNIHSPAYVEWRQKVYDRDRHTCQWPGCNSKKNLNAHHIRRWATYPMLRFEVGNGITLCKYHHDKVQSREEEFVVLFTGILARKLIEKIKKHAKHNP